MTAGREQDGEGRRSGPASDGETVDDLVREGRAALAQASFGPEPREARLLLGRVLGRSEAGLLARGDDPVAAGDAARFRALLARRLRGEPVAYLFGEREFYGRPFAVDPRVLIPRPETEHLIEAALAADLPPAPRVLDVGTGSGCIAVTLALELPGARVTASDRSLGALAVARANARRHEVAERVLPVAADLTAGIGLERFDLVVSNPPYVDPGVAARLSPEVRDFEPHLALFAAEHGRAAIVRLLDAASALRPGVRLLLEIGHDQSGWLAAEVAARSTIELLEVRRDLAGTPRTAVLRRG